jgi:hypothetical protein
VIREELATELDRAEQARAAEENSTATG